ncbi:MAG: hypothetical protein QF689_11125 [Candidatus Latescibacteria bacterium]|jgi:sugar phosphate isomerase/epimerase|nr:hypothetical protein [Gemmatimonadaceae bacterium]MDP6019110.1 hypothetical protein [Candidatus Latescibacterota bacterium]MDP7449128.1 hypothetical protein [Candidatus Latescibacterota bacterium]HJP32436.1 hypothetical protein [Candidatus Latescibacterota bacterium]
MKLALAVDYGFDDQLIFGQQLGADAVVVSLDEWRHDLLAGARNRVQQTGLALAGIRLPDAGPEDLDALPTIVTAAGAAGVNMLSCGLPPPRPSGSTEAEPDGRGGALVHHYGEADAADRGTPPVTIADALERFDPVAAAAGVQIAWRTGTPGAPYEADLLQLLEADRYPAMGLDVSLAGLAGTDYLPALEKMLVGGRLWLVEMSNLVGQHDQRDAFLDEGVIDIPRVLRLLHQGGYAGSLRAGPPPGMNEDSAWGHTGRSFDLGFLRAALQVVENRPDRRA